MSNLEVLVPIIYSFCWDTENSTHRIVRLLMVEAPYTKKIQGRIHLAPKKARDLQRNTWKG